jgi:hypothetical protein
MAAPIIFSRLVVALQTNTAAEHGDQKDPVSLLISHPHQISKVFSNRSHSKSALTHVPMYYVSHIVININTSIISSHHQHSNSTSLSRSDRCTLLRTIHNNLIGSEDFGNLIWIVCHLLQHSGQD